MNWTTSWADPCVSDQCGWWRSSLSASSTFGYDLEHFAISHLRTVATANPNAIALEHAGSALTYSQLFEDVCGSHDWLLRCGLQAGDRVAVPGSRTPGWVIGLLGAWSMGAIPVLLDPRLPEARRSIAERATGASWRLEVGSTAPSLLPLGPVRRTASPAYSHILFTTGTTGTPVGVASTISDLKSKMEWYVHEFGVGVEDRYGLLSGLGHDPVLRDLLAPIITGGTLVVPDREVHKVPGHLATFLIRNRITTWHTTPALAKFGRVDSASSNDLALLRVIVGGGMLDVRLAQRLKERSSRVFNAYGLTEVSQIACLHEFDSERTNSKPGTDEFTSVPIGDGAAGVRVGLRHEFGYDSGEHPDEIVLLARNSSVLTHSPKWEQNPPIENAGFVIATGDLGRRDCEGLIRVTGRLGRLKSVNGFRVSLDEIEALCRQLAGVIDCEAVVRSGAAGDRVHLRVVTDSSWIDSLAVQSHLAANLPEFSLPSRVNVQHGSEHLGTNLKVII